MTDTTQDGIRSLFRRVYGINAPYVSEYGQTESGLFWEVSHRLDGSKWCVTVLDSSENKYPDESRSGFESECNAISYARSL